jgi:HAD superfamily hydrolase (TIGR01509 family)
LHGQAVSLAIFDCDGVLVDSERISNELVADILSAHGVSLTWEEAMEIFVGQSVEGVRATALTRFAVQLPEDWAEEYYARMIPTLAERVMPIEGAPETVARLQDAGIPCCVASQGPPNKIEAALTRVGLWTRLGHAIFSAQNVARPKPAPDLFLYAARTMQVAPADCVVIEDSALGIAGALAAGMRVLAYCPLGNGDAAREVGATPFASMHEIPALLGVGSG